MIFCSPFTNFLMLGWKLGQAYRINTKMQELEKYSALYEQVAVAYGAEVAHRLKELANGLVGAEVPASGAGMHPPQPPASNHAVHHEPEFVAGDRLHPAPPPQPPQPVEARGVCDGCGQNVMSDDEGRQRENHKYYHADCVKGRCGGCGQVVHASSARASIRGVYWHAECM